MVDLHNHTIFCHHATGTMDEYVERAVAAGIQEFGFSEHSPWMFQYQGEQLAPTWDEFRLFLREAEALRERARTTGGPLIRLGIEVDYIPGQLETARKFTRNYPFDYHIGSVHNIGRWMFDHPGHLADWDARDVRRVYEEYFGLVKEMLEWGFIDILGHLDLPKKFGHRPAKGYMDLVQGLIDPILASGVVVELNTAGRDRPIGEFYPSADIVRLLASAGIPFTLGSDAHRPGEVGRYRQEALSLLRECGVKELTGFSGRRRVAFPL